MGGLPHQWDQYPAIAQIIFPSLSRRNQNISPNDPRILNVTALISLKFARDHGFYFKGSWGFHNGDGILKSVSPSFLLCGHEKVLTGSFPPLGMRFWSCFLISRVQNCSCRKNIIMLFILHHSGQVGKIRAMYILSSRASILYHTIICIRM